MRIPVQPNSVTVRKHATRMTWLGHFRAANIPLGSFGLYKYIHFMCVDAGVSTCKRTRITRDILKYILLCFSWGFIGLFSSVGRYLPPAQRAIVRFRIYIRSRVKLMANVISNGSYPRIFRSPRRLFRLTFDHVFPLSINPN